MPRQRNARDTATPNRDTEEALLALDRPTRQEGQTSPCRQLYSSVLHYAAPPQGDSSVFGASYAFCAATDGSAVRIDPPA